MTELPPALQSVDRVHVRLRGRSLLCFSGCDYFRLSSHPQVLAAAHEELDRLGLNVAASRVTSGNHPLHSKLETALARFFGAEAAVLASSGYATAFLAAQALAGEATHVLLDEKTHGCLRDSAQWLGCPTQLFRHRDPDHLSTLLGKLPSSARPLVGTDGMFAFDGALAPLVEYAALLPKKSWLLVDDSHGAGTLGRSGKGTWEQLTLKPRDPRIILTLTLSKAFGCYGGAVVGPSWLRERIMERSRWFTGNTPLPPMLANAALASIQALRRDRSLRHRLHENVASLRGQLRASGWPVEESSSPVLALMPSSASEVKRLKARLLTGRILPPFIRYPGGPDHGFFRIAVSSEHTAEQIGRLAAALLRCG